MFQELQPWKSVPPCWKPGREMWGGGDAADPKMLTSSCEVGVLPRLHHLQPATELWGCWGPVRNVGPVKPALGVVGASAGTSLVVLCLRPLPLQGARFPSLVGKLKILHAVLCNQQVEKKFCNRRSQQGSWGPTVAAPQPELAHCGLCLALLPIPRQPHTQAPFLGSWLQPPPPSTPDSLLPQAPSSPGLLERHFLILIWGWCGVAVQITHNCSHWLQAFLSHPGSELS